MEYSFRDGEIILRNKELTTLDRIVLGFLSFVDVDYVIVSGYIVILFGRDRHTEDVDIFIRAMDRKSLKRFYEKITASGRYYCINADTADDAYNLLAEKSSIRFAESGTIDPNFEIKFPQNALSQYSLNHAVTIRLNNKYRIKAGPLELQLAYKLYLGSEKDYDDAAHLYVIFKDDINRAELRRFIKRLNIKASVAKKIFGEKV